jgi:hypothetical protein
MCDEQPVLLKRRKVSNDKCDLQCIVHYSHCPRGENVTPGSDTGFKAIREALTVRHNQVSDVHHLEEVCAHVPSEFDEFPFIPPCLSTLRLHILRVNYQAFIWKNAHVSFPELPSPIGCGWKLNERNRLAVDWTAGNVLPLDLIDIMASEEVNESSSDGETAEETVEEDDEIDNVLDIVFEEEEEFC